MNLIIYVNSVFDEEKALFDLDSEKIILRGDEYHNKIYARIEGYLKALKEFGVYEKEVPSQYIELSHKHFKQIDFYE